MSTAAGDAPANTALVAAVESLRVQLAALLAAILLVGAWHWQNDGLWFQGDAPRHAASGLFFWDLLTTWPADPLAYALSYYARYPVLVLGAYPPLFHVIEGIAFGLCGPSPHVAKGLVLASASVTGLYALWWGRRWIAPMAGWAGACTVLLPGFIRYSNAVLLNVPAAALGLAALYHFHAWLEEGRGRDRTIFIACTLAAMLTYYPGAMVLPVAVAWMLFSRARVRGPFLWVPSGLIAVVVLVLAVTMPEHLARQVPSLAQLTSPANWTFYPGAVVSLVGATWVVLACGGAAAGLAMRVHRRATLRLVLAFAATLACLSVLPARDERYALLLGPILVLTAFVALAAAAHAAGRRRGMVAAVAVAVMVTATTRAALDTPVKHLTGIEAVARYLRANGPADAVLYSGTNDGVFAFYVRAMDPGFERRVALSGRLLYQYRQVVDFNWVETPHVTTPSDVVTVMRTTSGCRWVAVEVGGEDLLAGSERVLRRALEGPEFERVQSFPVTGGRPVTRIDLYRFTQALEPAPPMDLVFSSFSSRAFRGIEPIVAGQ